MSANQQLNDCPSMKISEHCNPAHLKLMKRSEWRKIKTEMFESIEYKQAESEEQVKLALESL